uniref:Uncharacterized protein n=1 Tax=Globodera rostochiensis TaxID=31243 RepID=A0A914HLB4_GLORO
MFHEERKTAPCHDNAQHVQHVRHLFGQHVQNTNSNQCAAAVAVSADGISDVIAFDRSPSRMLRCQCCTLTLTSSALGMSRKRRGGDNMNMMTDLLVSSNYGSC